MAFSASASFSANSGSRLAVLRSFSDRSRRTLAAVALAASGFQKGEDLGLFLFVEDARSAAFGMERLLSCRSHWGCW